MQTGLAYYLITAFSVRLLSQLGGNKDHSTKIYESCLTCMLVAVRSECEFVRKFPLKYSRGHFGAGTREKYYSGGPSVLWTAV